jgi:hypothetical protein
VTSVSPCLRHGRQLVPAEAQHVQRSEPTEQGVTLVHFLAQHKHFLWGVGYLEDVMAYVGVNEGV